MLHKFVLLFVAIGKRLILLVCKFYLLACNIEEFLNVKPYLGYQFGIKIEELRSKGLSSNCEEQNLGLCYKIFTLCYLSNSDKDFQIIYKS